jgi:hypothetical protein
MYVKRAADLVAGDVLVIPQRGLLALEKVEPHGAFMRLTALGETFAEPAHGIVEVSPAPDLLELLLVVDGVQKAIDADSPALLIDALQEVRKTVAAYRKSGVL